MGWERALAAFRTCAAGSAVVPKAGWLGEVHACDTRDLDREGGGFI